MSKINSKLFLIDILDSKKIKDYTKGMTFDDFVKDSKTVDAVLRNLEIIGEAVKQIPEEIKEKYREIPWNQIIGMRNRLIHAYFVIDYEIIWYIVRNEISILEKQVDKILRIEEF